MAEEDDKGAKAETAAEPAEAEPAKVEPAEVEPAKVEPAKVGPALDDPEWPVSSWGAGLHKLDVKWTAIEVRLAKWTLIVEMLLLLVAVTLSGMSTDTVGAEGGGGAFFRSLVGATILGAITHLATRKSTKKINGIAVTIAIIVGWSSSRLWAHTGVAYFSNIRNWFQTGSTVALFGGVSNIAKRTTVLLALLGGSIAAAQGKHINVDIMWRLVGNRARTVLATLGWLVASLVCFGATIGFIDGVAVAMYKVDDESFCKDDPSKTCKVPFGERASKFGHVMRRDAFLFGRQASLDLKAIPKVASGKDYKGWLYAAEWNAWIRESEDDWKKYYAADDVKQLYTDASDTSPRVPKIQIPGAQENPQELLLRELTLIFPFGFFMIGLRFLLRCLLALSGHLKVDPNAQHAEDLGGEDKEKDDDGDPDDALTAKGGAA